MMYLGQVCTYQNRRAIWAGYDTLGVYLWVWELDSLTELRLGSVAGVQHVQKAGVQQLDALEGCYLGEFAVKLNAGFFGRLDLALTKTAYPDLWYAAVKELRPGVAL